MIYHGRPSQASNRERGLPVSARLRNIKLVSSALFRKKRGMPAASKNRRHLGSCFTSGLSSWENSNTRGYITSSICTTKLCIWKKFMQGSVVQFENSSAAMAPGMLRAYSSSRFREFGFMECHRHTNMLMPQRCRGR